MDKGFIMPDNTLAKFVKKIVEKVEPNLRQHMRLSLEGVVEAVHDDDTKENYYTVDIVIGEDDSDQYRAQDVKVAAIWAQDGYGVFAIPEVGAKVVIAFEDGNPNTPYVDSLRWNAGKAPKGFTAGTFAIRGKHGQKIEFKPGSNETVLSQASLKMITTEKKQEYVSGNDEKTVAGNKTEEIKGATNTTFDSKIEIVNRFHRVSSGSYQHSISGDYSLAVGGGSSRSVAGSISNKCAGSKSESILFNEKKFIGGGYEAIICGTPGIASIPYAYRVLASNAGGIAFDSFGGMIGIGSDPLVPCTLVNIGQATPGAGLVQLGGLGAAGQPAIHGPSLVAWLTKLLTYLQTPLQIGNLGVPTVPNPAFSAMLAELTAMLSTPAVAAGTGGLLSSKVFISAL